MHALTAWGGVELRESVGKSNTGSGMSVMRGHWYAIGIGRDAHEHNHIANIPINIFLISCALG